MGRRTLLTDLSDRGVGVLLAFTVAVGVGLIVAAQVFDQPLLDALIVLASAFAIQWATDNVA